MQALIIFIIYLCLIPLEALADSKQQTPSNKQEFIEFLKKKENIEIQDVSKQLKQTLDNPQSFFTRAHSHKELLDYYNKNLTAFAKLYPKDQFTIIPDRPLESFFGRLRLASDIVHYIPFTPIGPEIFNLKDLSFKKINVKYKDKNFYGIRFESSLPLRFTAEQLEILKTKTFQWGLRYIADVNARALGFTHGQLILELSPGTKIAEQFEYNGLRDWSKHNRYKKTDQASIPIKLTNNAHSSSQGYLISSHPDFSVDAYFEPGKPVVMTFFLWKKAELFGVAVPPTNEELPTFISQVVFKPVSKP